MKRRAVLSSALASALAPLAFASVAIAKPAKKEKARTTAEPSEPSEPSEAAEPAPPASSDIVDEVKALLHKQARQWSAGDLAGFCSHYADDCLFMSPSGLTRGRKKVFERYKKKYSDKAAMGTLTLDVLSTSASDKVASVALEWTLSYPDRAKMTGFSLIALKRRIERWKIVHDASV